MKPLGRQDPHVQETAYEEGRQAVRHARPQKKSKAAAAHARGQDLEVSLCGRDLLDFPEPRKGLVNPHKPG